MYRLVFAFLIVISLSFLGFVLYEYPVEKRLAERAVEQYMEGQGIPKEMIKSKEYLKDYKQGGYEISIELRDDPGLTYHYIWRKRGVVLLVFRGGAGMDSGMKYPPLK